MNHINRVILEVDDVATASAFYYDALGLDPANVMFQPSDAPTSGFRGFALSLIVSQPDDVDAIVDAALNAGAMTLKPPKKSFWGYGGAFSAPDGTIWQVASESKKNDGPATMTITDLVLLLGVVDVKATKAFYVEHGFAVNKSFGGKYAEFEAPDGSTTLALNGRNALAKQVGVPAEGNGSHRIVLNSDAGPLTDPDGFRWQ